MSLPSPVQRRGQKMYKSELWETQRKVKDNMDRIGDWTSSYSKLHTSTDDGEGKILTFMYLGDRYIQEHLFSRRSAAEEIDTAARNNPLHGTHAGTAKVFPCGRCDYAIRKQSFQTTETAI